MLLLLSSTSACSSIALGDPDRAFAQHYDAVVDAKFAGRDGMEIGPRTRGYRSIGAAIAAAPAGGAAPYTVMVRSGRYREKLTVATPNVHLVGESRDRTVLTFDAAADTPNPAGGTYGTRGSYTLRIDAPDFSLERMTVENAWDYAANARKAEGDPAKFRNTQAVAVMTDSASDRASFRDCRIAGHQDTLFPNGGRSHFSRCEISGSVDFIFGAGQVVIEDCDIVSRDRGSSTNNGYITAPSTPKSMEYGFLILRSRLKKESPAMAPKSVALGRPWHPSADPNVSSAVAFVDTWMDDHITAEGWDRMSSVDRATGTRIWFEWRDNRMYEVGSTGPGAPRAGSPRRVLTAEEAKRFTKANVLRGWNP